MSEPTVDPADQPPVVQPEEPSVRLDADAEARTAAGAGEPDAGAPEAASGFGRHPVLLYTLKRILLLLVVGGVLYLFGVRGIFLILFAFLISGFIAMVALKDSREGAAYGITHAVKKVNDRIDASTRAEDYDDLDDDLVEPSATATPDGEPRA